MCLHGGQAMPIAPNPSVTLMGMLRKEAPRSESKEEFHPFIAPGPA